MKPSVIVSDIHLGAGPASAERAFLGFLDSWRGRARSMLINGDLFDFWFEYRTVIQARYFKVLKALVDLNESGVELALVGGNHDFWGGRFLEGEIGIKLLDGPIEMELGGRRALVAHGDGLGEGDLGYRVLKRTLRARATHWLMRRIHPDLAERIVQRISRTGAESPRDSARSEERSRILEELAIRYLGERAEIDIVVFGHCHRPQLQEIEPGRFYINSGDWVAHRTYTVVTQEEITQREWATE